MDEYIEREAAIAWFMPYAHTGESIDADVVISDINGMKSADVAPVRHGRWEEASDGDGIVCPFCRTDFCTIIYDTEYFNYCPNCGAKMDEKEDKHEDYT